MDEESADQVIGGNFASVAGDYVAAIEEAAAGRDLDPLGTARLLAGLIAAALDLPSVEPTAAPSPSSVDLPDVVWPAGFPDFYWDVFHPLALGDKKPASMGSLVDDLLDIYRDVKPPLLAWNSGDHEDAVWEWRFSFRSHWHRHAASALKVLLIVGDSAARPAGEGTVGGTINPPSSSVGGANTPAFIQTIGNLLKAATDALRF